jgi:hypothetical protein
MPLSDGADSRLRHDRHAAKGNAAVSYMQAVSLQRTLTHVPHPKEEPTMLRKLLYLLLVSGVATTAVRRLTGSLRVGTSPSRAERDLQRWEGEGGSPAGSQTP